MRLRLEKKKVRTITLCFASVIIGPKINTNGIYFYLLQHILLKFFSLKQNSLFHINCHCFGLWSVNQQASKSALASPLGENYRVLRVLKTIGKCCQFTHFKDNIANYYHNTAKNGTIISENRHTIHSTFNYIIFTCSSITKFRLLCNFSNNCSYFNTLVSLLPL